MKARNLRTEQTVAEEKATLTRLRDAMVERGIPIPSLAQDQGPELSSSEGMEPTDR